MQQQSFILSLRQRFKWLPKASLPKLLSSICTRTTEGRRGQIVGGNIRLAPCVERLPFCISIMSITPTIAALTKSATIPFLYGSPLPLLLRLCQPFSASTISSVCVIPFKLSAWLCQCFISARIHFGISVSYLKLYLILRPLIPLSATGALSLHRCLTICVFSLFSY